MKKIISIISLVFFSIILSLSVLGADLSMPFEDDLHYTGTVGNDWTEDTTFANGLGITWDNIANVTGTQVGVNSYITVETVNDVPDSSWSMNITWYDLSQGNGTFRFGVDTVGSNGVYCEIADGNVCAGVGTETSCGDDGPASTMGTATLSYNHTSKTAQCQNNYNGNTYNVTNPSYNYLANSAEFRAIGSGDGNFVSWNFENFAYGGYEDLLYEEPAPPPPAPPPGGVPEFGSMTALLAMALIGTGFFFMRRREE